MVGWLLQNGPVVTQRKGSLGRHRFISYEVYTNFHLSRAFNTCLVPYKPKNTASSNNQMLVK
ncbi:hypothetical protein HUJ04_001004 [Dendroctonus ponderosae]|nr:hypothetical protein HUJ04_001004 [Dendroctonus ponderosae]KAH1018398.1 hypothetical protein HUJ05_006179 [Dendroctonus ponderosae]